MDIDYDQIFANHLKTGHSKPHVKLMQHLFGFNVRPKPASNVYKKLASLFTALNCHSAYIDDSKAGTADLSATGHVAM